MDIKTPAEEVAEKQARVVALAKEGYAAWKIAEQTGYSLVQVRSIIGRQRRQEAMPGDQSHDTRRGREFFPHAEVISLAQQGKTRTDISVISGYSVPHIINILRAAKSRGKEIPRSKSGQKSTSWRLISREEAEAAITGSHSLFAASIKLNISQRQLAFLRAYHRLDVRPTPTLRSIRFPRQDRETLRQKAVLVLRDSEWTYDAIGTALGVSRQRAEQIWMRARQTERVQDDLNHADEGHEG